jgi:hypothetical protein
MTLSSVGGSGGSVVVLFVSWRNNSAQTVTGVTYGGNAMTKIGSTINSGGGGPLEAWYYITSSDGDAVVTFSAAPANAQATALVFSGTHATTPIGTEQTSGAADNSAPYETSTSAVTSETDGLCVDGFALRGDSTGLTIGADQDQRSAQNASGSLFHRTSTKAGAASVTMSWSWSTNALHYAHIVVPLAPSAAASGEVAGTPMQNLHNSFGTALAARINGALH